MSALRIWTLADLRGMPDRGYVLKGLMSPGEMSVWWGPPKCGKSFLLTHLAYAAAQGRSVFGRRVKACRVLYVAAEGEGGYGRRMAALATAHGDASAFCMVLQPVDLLHPAGDVEAVVRAARDNAAGLVVIDTLARALAGGDENSPDDMGRFIRSVDRIRGETGAHVAIVHHGGKDATRGMRGHSSLLGAADLVVEVATAGEGRRAATITHAKDDAAGEPLRFNLAVVELGKDADGDERTTCIVQEVDPLMAPPADLRIPPAARRTLAILQDTIAGPHGANLPTSRGFPPGVRGCSQEAFIAQCEARHLSQGSTKRDRDRARRREVERLSAARMIASRDGWVWPCGPGDQRGPSADQSPRGPR